MAENCTCAGCVGLAERFRDDPVLLTFYRANLLKRGWAGSIDDVERAYMLSHAPWYNNMVERASGRRIGMGRPARFSVTGEVLGVKVELQPTPTFQ